MSVTFENVSTTVEPPVCPECQGAGIVAPMGFARNCDACKGDGYEHGDNASLLASVPPDPDWGAFYKAAITEPGVVQGTRWERVSGEVEVVAA